MGSFLIEQWDEHLTLTAYAESLGLTNKLITRLLDDGLPSEATLQRLRARFGDALPPTRANAEQVRQRGRELQARYGERGRTAAALAKIHAQNRGRRQTPETIAKRVATQTATGNLARNAERFSIYIRSERGRVVAALVGILRAHQSLTPAALQRRAAEVGARHGLPGAAVMEIWRPILRRHNISTGQRGAQRVTDHPGICAFFRQHPDATWRTIAAGPFPHANPNGQRIAHQQWEKRHQLPPCRS